MEQLEQFREEVRAWLEENCPASMRTPLTTDDDVCWGGRKFSYQSERAEIVAGAYGSAGLDGAAVAEKLRWRRPQSPAE